MTTFFLRTTILAIGACIVGCSPDVAPPQHVNTSVAFTEATEAANGMRRHNLGNFSIALPKSMQQVRLTTTDSAAWEFQDQTVTVHIEQGLYAPTAEKHDELNYRSLHRTIDGETCDIGFFLVRKSDLLAEPAKKTCMIGHFSESRRVGDPVFISICFSTTDMEPRAMEMLGSVVFAR